MAERKILKKITNLLSGPTLLHYSIPVLIAYLVVGTISQKYIGLYDSTKIFFSAPFIWLGPIPLPGVPIVLGVIFVNLSFKLLFKSPWKLQKAGIFVTHIGAMFLLLGGLFTALYSHEGYIALGADEKKSYVTDYHIRELRILDDEGAVLHSVNQKRLYEGKTIDVPNAPAKIQIVETCRNCKIVKRDEADDRYAYEGMAQHMSLMPDRLRVEDEENLSGVMFAFIENNQTDKTEKSQAHVMIEDIPQTPSIETDKGIFHFNLGRQIRDIPFKVELLEFEREMYPGTDMAKSYSSRVRIYDGSSQWESLISMNEPLRYKGYTLFQSSFLETETGDISVLTVVWNAGRAFPYISGITMCIGLSLHLMLGFRRRSYKKGAQNA